MWADMGPESLEVVVVRRRLLDCDMLDRMTKERGWGIERETS